jgi:hypothetical protein
MTMHGNLERGSLLRLGFTLVLSLLWTTPVIDQKRSSRHTEDGMEIIHGTVREILPATDGALCAFVIDGGMEIHFSADRTREVAGLVSLRSRLEICGTPYTGRSGDPHLDAQFIMNLDSRRFINLRDSLPQQSPEVPFMCSPTEAEAAPLAPPESERMLRDKENSIGPRDLWRGVSEGVRQNSSRRANVTSSGQPSADPTGSLAHRVRADKDAATRSVELAYDSLHRAQALLAYVKIFDLQTPDLGQLLTESKHTYQQAILNYQKQEYAVADEFAAASGELSRSVELLVSRNLRADSNYPTLVPAPPGRQTGGMSSDDTERSLTRVASLLARIHWLVQNGTLPLEDRTQVRKIASWGDMFYVKGRESLRMGSIAEASYFINAAEAVAHSAEHVCKQDYITHAAAVN